jgi:hypothetical protein
MFSHHINYNITNTVIYIFGYSLYSIEYDILEYLIYNIDVQTTYVTRMGTVYSDGEYDYP